MTALIVTLLLFLTTGRAVAALLALAVPAARLPRLCAYFVYGAVSYGIALYLFGLAGVPLRSAVLLLPPAAASAASAWLRRRPALTVPAQRHPAAASVALAVPLAVLLSATAVLPMRDWDGRAMWLMKARSIAWDGSIDGRFFQGTLGLNQHNHYPLLMPIDAAAVMRLSGDLENESARWLYALLAAAGLVFARELLARSFGSPAAAWSAAAMAWLPCMAAVEGGALSACADVPLALFGGLPVLLLSATVRSSADERAAGLLLAGAVLTKSEGIVAAGAVVAALLLARACRRAGWRAALPASVALPPAAAMALLSWWRTTVPNAHDERYGVLLQDLPQSLGQIPATALVVAGRALSPQAWGLFWPWTLLALVVALSGPRRSMLLLPAVPMVMMLSTYVAVLTVTTWRLSDLATLTVDRLLMHMLIPAGAVLTLGAQRVIEWAEKAKAPDRLLPSPGRAMS